MQKFYGLVSYLEALKLQEQKQKEVLLSKEDFFLIGLEHKPVLSLGIRAKEEEDLILSKEEIQSKGYEIIKSDRGGQATLHMPKQLVIYPIVNLKAFDLSLRSYVCSLAQITKRVFKELGLDSKYLEEDPGIYAEKGKIAFIGIRVKRSITSHGLAINISNPLEPYQWIYACGKRDAPISRLLDYNINIKPEELFTLWVKEFSKDFS